MRKLLLTLSIITFLGTISSFAQNQKFGHINSNLLMESMPERDSAMKTLEKEYKEMEGILEDMQVEFNKKYQTYVETQATLSDIAKKTKEQELQELQQRIQAYQQSAQQDLQKREAELIQPIMEKAKKAIEEVGKENGFIYIFDAGSGVVLYQSENSTDVLPLVQKKLGIVK